MVQLLSLEVLSGVLTHSYASRVIKLFLLNKQSLPRKNVLAMRHFTTNALRFIVMVNNGSYTLFTLNYMMVLPITKQNQVDVN